MLHPLDPGWVYAALNDKTQLTKLGFTRKHPLDRMRSLRSAGALGVWHLVEALPVVEVLKAEQYVHGLALDYRIQGEQFHLTPEQVRSYFIKLQDDQRLGYACYCNIEEYQLGKALVVTDIEAWCERLSKA